MANCSPNDLSVDLPSGPSGPSLPGFGLPNALKIPSVNPFPDGFPEDLLELFNNLQLLIPPGTLKPALNPNFGKDVFDGIMKLLDQFFPFLMLYKFFLPVLNIIICIIEVLCSLVNPFKLARAMNRLFRNCIPEFLNLFPYFALIIMIISLLILLLALIEYIIGQISKFIKAIIKNILALNKAFQHGDQNAVLAIAKKLGSLLCTFQNLFVILSIFDVVITIIKDILGLAFSIPPCNDGDPSDSDGCCTPDVCPAIVKTNYTRTTGNFQYLNTVSSVNLIPGLPTGLSSTFSSLSIPVRIESWQLHDSQQEVIQKFINIVNAYDVTTSPKPIFFPTDLTYSQFTSPKQAAYTVDLKLFYNPNAWGRIGQSRYIKFKDCIVLSVPTTTSNNYNNTTSETPTGTLSLVGGVGYEDDGVTPLKGFDKDGVTQVDNVASLNTFLHKPDQNSSIPILLPTDGYVFQNIEYVFKPNLPTLLSKDLVTLGCEPSLALNKAFINTVFAGDLALKIQSLNNLVNGATFPDTNSTQQCLATALSALRSNMNLEGAAQFQATTSLCLQKLKDDASSSLGDLIGIGAEPCKSDFTRIPNVQFTTKPIKVSVNLKERNGIALTTGLPSDVANTLASKIKAHATFGEVGNFSYDGYQSFTANLSSSQAGKGELMISFDNNIFCTNTIPKDIAIDPTHDLQSLAYQFIYTPSGAITSEGDTDGSPRRDSSDESRS